MEIKNIEQFPEKIRGIIRSFTEDLLKAYSDDIISIFAYGSVTGKYYNPKTSDINIGIVVKDLSLGMLKPVLKVVKAGMKKKITAPLFLTTSYIKMSLDTFPLEFISMKETRCVVFGDDVLGDIEINKEDLRRECEYQLKGKLLTIRQAYLEQALKRKGLEALIKHSFRALMPVFQGMLRIKVEGNMPADKEEMLACLGSEFNVDTGSFLEVLKDKETDGRIGGKEAEVFLDEFLAALEKLSVGIDNV